MPEKTAAPNTGTACLVVIDQDKRRSRLPVHTFPFGIGRAPGNALVLRDGRVSREHARITSQNGMCVLEDYKSTHGVWVNGTKISGEYVLRGGDRIDFGVPEGYQLLFAPTAEEGEKLLARPVAVAAGRAGATNLDRLRAVLEVARAPESFFSVDDVLHTVVDAALQVTGAERGFLLLFDEHRELIVRTARTNRGGDLPPDALRVPRGLIQKALESRRDLLSMSFDPSQSDSGAAGQTVMAMDLRSVVCVPVLQVNISGGAHTAISSAANSSAGVLYMDSRVATVDLATGNRELLQTLAIEISSVLENARLLEEERGKQKMEEELELARRIQQGLLPRALPTGGWLRIRGSSQACHQVGGDYYDAIRAADGVSLDEAWRIMVADVSGKGTSSALMASFLQGVFLGASASPDLAATLGRVNDFLADRDEVGKYATVFYATIDASGAMTYANAGHCAPIMVKKDGSIAVLRPTSMPVGMMPGTKFVTEQCSLSAGDLIVLYTDGVTEAQDAAGEFYGRTRLRQAITWAHAARGAADCAAVHAVISDDLREFMGTAAQTDDVTLVVVEYHGPA